MITQQKGNDRPHNQLQARSPAVSVEGRYTEEKEHESTSNRQTTTYSSAKRMKHLSSAVRTIKEHSTAQVTPRVNKELCEH